MLHNVSPSLPGVSPTQEVGSFGLRDSVIPSGQELLCQMNLVHQIRQVCTTTSVSSFQSTCPWTHTYLAISGWKFDSRCATMLSAGELATKGAEAG